MVTTKHTFRAETQNINKEETDKNIIENHHTKMADNHKEKETMKMKSNQKTKD